MAMSGKTPCNSECISFYMLSCRNGANNDFPVVNEVCTLVQQAQLSRKILQYHENGFIEDLQDLYFRRSKCNDNANDGQLQGEAAPMNFNQHAGLYLLLAVGVFVCVGLMFLEHATFRWLVPYWRKKPPKSFWKSYSMMFWSQVSKTFK